MKYALLLAATLLLLNLSCGTTPPKKATTETTKTTVKPPKKAPTKTIKKDIIEETSVETKDEEIEYTHAERMLMDAQEDIKKISHLLKTNQKTKLAEYFELPIARPHPVPPIRTAREFVQRFYELFDRELINNLINHPKKWDYMPRYDNLMFDAGQIYMSKIDGKFILEGEHLKTAKSKQVQAQAIANERKTLHPSVRKNSSSAVLSFRTEDQSWTGRIDKLSGKSSDDLTMQLSLYKKGSPLRGKPDYTLQGVQKTEGSCYNDYYCFVGHGKSFQVAKLQCWGGEMIPQALYVFDKELAFEDAPFHGNEEQTHTVDWVIWQELL